MKAYRGMIVVEICYEKKVGDFMGFVRERSRMSCQASIAGIYA
jgi:hypothetical protein